MKYLKLFEQIDEWDDPFGEDVSPEELKVGDKVEILNNRGGGRLIIGSIGTITEIQIWLNDSFYFVAGEEMEGSPDLLNRKSSWCYNGNQLKKVEE